MHWHVVVYFIYFIISIVSNILLIATTVCFLNGKFVSQTVAQVLYYYKQNITFSRVTELVRLLLVTDIPIALLREQRPWYDRK
jgi:hypothetical protein